MGGGNLAARGPHGLNDVQGDWVRADVGASGGSGVGGVNF